MKAILCRTYGLPDTLTLEDVPSPTPGPGDVLIQVKACSLNFPDTLTIRNMYQFKPPLPFSPGSESSGVVNAVGEGVTHLINYTTQDLHERIKEITQSRGVDVVYDPVGDKWAESAIRSLAWRGRYLVVGFAGGEIPKIPLNLALLKGSALMGVFWVMQGKLAPHISKRYSLAEAPQALTDMMERRIIGKAVVVVDEV